MGHFLQGIDMKTHKNCKRNKTKKLKEISLLNIILTKPDTDNVTLFFNLRTCSLYFPPKTFDCH